MFENYKYNYIYFNASYSDKFHTDYDDYNAICLRDLEKVASVQIVPLIMYRKPWIFKFLYYFHEKLSNKLHFPFVEMWFPFFFKNKFHHSKKPLCFIVATSQIPTKYVEWLRKKYPNAKFVRIHRDLLKVTCRNGYTMDFLRKNFDIQMSFDKKEAELNGFIYFDEIESIVDVSDAAQYPSCDVFFAGKAKDRLPKILQILNILNMAGLNCYFYLTEVPKEQRVNIDGIVYADKYMPFKEMLYRTVRANCLLEINQGGAIGYTSRFIEAVLYNKKIMSDNPFVKESKYYNPKFVYFVSSADTIDTSFVRSTEQVDFNYTGDFSPINILSILTQIA